MDEPDFFSRSDSLVTTTFKKNTGSSLSSSDIRLKKIVWSEKKFEFPNLEKTNFELSHTYLFLSKSNFEPLKPAKNSQTLNNIWKS